MEIFVDADACPVVRQIENIARERQIPLTLYCDTSHVLSSSYAQVKIIGQGADAVDFALMMDVQRGDVVVTQDYGVAVMALGKGAHPIHQSGRWYTEENIDGMLMERHLAKQARRSSKKNHLKGPKKRTHADDERFVESFLRLLNSLEETGDPHKKGPDCSGPEKGGFI